MYPSAPPESVIGVISMHSNHLLRASEAPHDSKVGFVELFFDLDFIFAITQLAHTQAGAEP